MSGVSPTTLQIVGAAFFAIAVVHTFATQIFEKLAHLRPNHAGAWHLLGEVEVAFGFWAMALIVVMMFVAGEPEATRYLDSCDFTEPMFVFAVMVVAGSKPIFELTSRLANSVARALPLPDGMALYFTALAVVPLLGSFITEPAAITLAALILRDGYYSRSISPRLCYATLGVLFVNVSIGGTLTPYAAPPVLMVASTWGWDVGFTMSTFGWRVTIAVVVNALAVTLLFRDELKRTSGRPDSPIASVPAAVSLTHLAILAGVVWFSHHPKVFMGLLLFFIGYTTAYSKYQSRLMVREGLMVAFFLAGVVVLGGQQRWWLEPLLRGMDASAVYYGATALTAITDNAALTYLGSLVDGTSDEFKYALVAGAVTGGGLTVIANAPNPVGFAILRGHFEDHAISPFGLLAAALPPTLVAVLALRFSGETTMTFITDMIVWAEALSPTWVFLMLLPFVVAAAALLQGWLESSRSGRPGGQEQRSV